MKQQHRKQKEVNQTLNLFPHRAVERGVTAHQKTTQNEGEVWEEKLGVIHEWE
jgi:hypothetical protein